MYFLFEMVFAPLKESYRFPHLKLHAMQQINKLTCLFMLNETTVE